jgi:hypothetical protein
MDAATVINASISERDFQATVRAYAELNGWRVHTVWNSRKSPEGWPDLFMARCCVGGAAEVIAAELKTERGRVTEAQRTWLALLNLAGIPAYLWRPSDWPAIERRLTR